METKGPKQQFNLGHYAEVLHTQRMMRPNKGLHVYTEWWLNERDVSSLTRVSMSMTVGVVCRV